MFKVFRRFCLAGLLVWLSVASTHAWGAAGDDDFMRARQAYASGEQAAFEKHAARIPATHPLQIYLAYWRLQKNGNMENDDRVSDFLSTYPDTWLAERVRADWLKSLGRREMWPAYIAEYPRLVRPDITHQCYAHRARLQAGDRSRIKEAVALWYTGADQPSA